MACSSERGRGFTDSADSRSLVRGSLDAQASAVDSIVTTFDAVALNMKASDVEAFVAANFMEEEGFTAAVTDSVVVDSMVRADFTVEAMVAGFMVAATAGMVGTAN
jgi:hypothetical protein